MPPRTTSRESAPPTGRGKPAPQRSSWLKRGDAIDQTYKKDRERIERRQAVGFDPLRFYLKEGDSCEIIVLDASIDDAVGFYEHDLKDDEGRYGNHEACPGDHGNCILCDKVGHSYFVVMLTVLVLKEWTSKKSGEVHEYSRMLLPLKSTSLPQFRKLEKAAIKKHGTMRGMYLLMTREIGGKTARIGAPDLLDGGSTFAMYTEKELVKNFGHKAVLGRDNKVLKEKNADLQPYNYDLLFPEPDADDLRSRFGGGAEPGSKKANKAAVEDDEDEAPPKKRRKPPVEDDDDDDAPPVKKRRKPPVDDDEDDAPPPKKRTKPPVEDDEDDAPPVKKRSKPPVEDDDDDEDEAPPKKRRKPPVVEDDEDDDAPPVKKRRKPPVVEEEEEPVKKRRKPPVAEDDDDDDDDDDAPPVKKRRKPPVEDEDDDDEDDAPPVKKRSKPPVEDDDDDAPPVKKRRKPPVEEDDDDDAPPPKKGKAKDDEDDEWFD